MTIMSAALLLFLILDPLGNIPVFLSVLKPLPAQRQRVVLARELLIALMVLMGFLWGQIRLGVDAFATGVGIDCRRHRLIPHWYPDDLSSARRIDGGNP